MRSSLPVALAAALALAGCTQTPTTSTDDFKGDEKDVAQVIADLSDDAARNKQAHVCGEIVTERLQKEIAGDSSCPDEVKKAFEDADSAVLEVEDVTITGTEATAEVSTEDGDDKVTRDFKLVKEDGEWRIDSFGPA